jgi:hypothetical protein
MIISKGLGDILADHYDQLSACVREKYAEEHSDLAFTACVFELGYAPTDFGSFLLGGPRLLDTYAPANGGHHASFIEERVRGYRSQRAAAAAAGSMDAAGVDDTVVRTLSWHAKAARAGGVMNMVQEIFDVTQALYELHGSPTHRPLRGGAS